jgi:hypothetical protein
MPLGLRFGAVSAQQAPGDAAVRPAAELEAASASILEPSDAAPTSMAADSVLF